MINPIWLRSFCTLVDVGHFTRTAQQLHMTQSGVSQHIHKLEQQLGLALLLREGKQFTLTQAGERLYEEGQSIVMSLSNLEQRVAFDPPYEGLVRVMSPGSVGLKLYPELIELQKVHPKLVMDYRFAPNASVETAIAQDEADIGFMTRPASLSDVACQAIGQESLLLVTPKHITEPSWDALMALGFIDHPDGAHHAQLLLSENYPQFQSSHGFTQAGFSNQIHLILQPVSHGLGFTVLPAYAVDAFQSPQSINVHRLNKPVSETLYLCTRKHKACSQRVENVMAHATQYLSKK